MAEGLRSPAGSFFFFGMASVWDYLDGGHNSGLALLFALFSHRARLDASRSHTDERIYCLIERQWWS